MLRNQDLALEALARGEVDSAVEYAEALSTRQAEQAFYGYLAREGLIKDEDCPAFISRKVTFFGETGIETLVFLQRGTGPEVPTAIFFDYEDSIACEFLTADESAKVRCWRRGGGSFARMTPLAEIQGGDVVSMAGIARHGEARSFVVLSMEGATDGWDVRLPEEMETVALSAVG